MAEVNVRELKEALDSKASKVSEVIAKAREEARASNSWVNIPIYRGSRFNAEFSVSPNGTVFLVLRGAKVRNKVMIGSAELLEEMLAFVAAFGNSKFYEATLEVLRSNPTRRKGVVIEW